MLKRYNQTIRALFFFSDLFLLFICWVSAYLLRFNTLYIPRISAAPSFHVHLSLTFYVLAVYAVIFSRMGLYEPMRTRKVVKQFVAVFWASTVAMVCLISVIYFFLKDFRYSRVTFLIFWVLNINVLFILRIIIVGILRKFRKRGYNLRHVLIVGSGNLARAVAEKISKHLEFGLSIVGFLSRDKSQIGKEIFAGIKVIGVYDDLKDITRNKGIDQAIFCLESKEERLIRPLLKNMDNESVDLKVILELGDIFTLRNKNEELDGFTVLSLREGPLSGWASLAKRVFDIIVSLLSLVVFAPLMCLIALLVKLTSNGPVFYSQERVGMDGRKFTLYKFRSMKTGAESNSGAVFARKGDFRITKVGKVLRRLSFDELPQLINVLRGDLSLVGPRPERPEFVAEFYKNIPKYMLRHKIRLGMTGWAQVNGLRGDSCIKTRLEYDLYYIEHWSFGFDLKILFLTFFAVIKGEGAY
ncbi:MAG: undecaprenyl-phosphate glucose phosphotransferase [Elusimicrobiota bacterium]